ncbi:hypothetical protein VRK_13140 [Vibrio sp. MEBiC08052]|nr:hypothetical protein VRK_13140 [Vibrio sp. MEBiC08052]
MGYSPQTFNCPISAITEKQSPPPPAVVNYQHCASLFSGLVIEFQRISY